VPPIPSFVRAMEGGSSGRRTTPLAGETMKRAIFLLTAALLTGFSGGCHHNLCDDGCNACGSDGCSGGCGRVGKHYSGPYSEEYTNSGPPTAGVTYPYYTVRGPRDFLANQPRGIGP